MKGRRLELGLTLQALADRCARHGVSVTEAQLSKIERGVHIPRPRLRALLARMLDVDMSKVGSAPSAPGSAEDAA